eukprot:SAG11_NODE_8053_length_1065_cov_0.908903_1_plen_98_part_10
MLSMRSTLGPASVKVGLDAALFPQEFAAGERIIRQGDAGDNFYVIEHGARAVSRVAPDSEAEQVLGELLTGAAFGELALLSDEPRSATITASSAVTCC